MIYAKILGTGGYLPARVVTNHDLEQTVDTTDEWITERTGIKSRHIAAPHETTSMMATHAAREALTAAQVDASQLDMIIVATCTPDQTFPSTACLVQNQLKTPNCPAFDVNAVCAGFNYALTIANQFITAKTARYILVIGAETMSKIIDWQDRTTCVLFGDGAGAVVLGAANEPGILTTCLHANGNYKDILYAPSALTEGNETPYIKMRGRELFRVAVECLGGIVTETLEKSGFKQAQIDWLIPHQANFRIIAAMAKKLELPMKRVVVTVDQHGNTSAASVPLALNTAVRDGRVQRGDVLLLESFGAGVTWGSALIRY